MFLSFLNKYRPPRNLALSVNNVEEELKSQKQGKASAKLNHVRFASDGGDILRPQTNRPTSCLSLGMH